MKNWLIKKLGGFTREEYIDKCIAENQPKILIKNVCHIEQYESLLEFYNGEENKYTPEDIRYELMRNFVPLLVNKIKITKNFETEWNRMVYRGELIVVEDKEWKEHLD